VKLPLIPLSDCAGQVIAVGPGVTGVQPGSRVSSIFMQRWLDGPIDDDKAASALGGPVDGVLAQRICLRADGLIPIPNHLSFEEAATLPCAAVTAWNALFRSGGLKPGESVLIQGTGGVSIFGLQFAKMAGARVISTSGSDQKLERLRSMGVADLINYKTNPNWEKTVREMTGGIGVDHVVEVGGAGTLPSSIRAVRRGGHIALIGVLTGGGEIDPRQVLFRSIRLQGITVGSKAMFAEMNAAISLAGLRPVVDRVFGFEQVPDAMRHLESGAHFGKVCVGL
jgi:NADPH:quinone reductase-like Zn-dependent oxidoreductase